MKRLYTHIRLAAYACGVGGLFCTLYGDRRLDETRAAWVTTGGALLLVMFLLFLASYVLLTFDRLRRR